VSLSVELPRLRAAAAGGVCGVTAVAAHAQAHGQLPGAPALLAVTGTAALLGLLAGRRPAGQSRAAGRTPWRLLPALLAGQLLIHLLLIALTGAHHQLVTGPMTVMHAGGTLLALALITAAELLIGAVAALARRVVALTVTGRPHRRPVVPVTGVPAAAPSTLLFLGTVGTRGPPHLV